MIDQGLNYFKRIEMFVLIILTSVQAFGVSIPGGSCPIGETLISKKSTSEIAIKIQELSQTESCDVLDKSCELRGEGDVAGVWKKHRIFINNSAIVGSNDMDSLMEKVVELQASGICRQ